MSEELRAKPKVDPKAILLVAKDEEKDKCVAELILRPNVQSASTIKAFNSEDDNINVNAIICELSQQSQAVHNGKMSRVEEMLVAQAHTLDAIFSSLARRSKANMGEYTDTADRYMRLGLKAQSQCRATLETLAAIKNPPIVYARQANIAQGNQQVNNGVLTHAHAGKAETVQNELLEDKRDEVERVDLRASSKTGRSDPAMETVGAINRCKNDRRQSAICTKLL